VLAISASVFPSALFSSRVVSSLRWGPARAPLEGMIEGAGLRVAEKPSDLREWQITLRQVVLGHVRPQTVQYRNEAMTFGREPAGKRALADTEMSGDRSDFRLPVRQKRR
jgi:hypothetical protein